MHVIEPLELETLIKFGAEIVLLDVRKKAAADKEPARIAGAAWRDHEAAADWAGEVPDGVVTVCYCVHGHEVSQRATRTLRDAGKNAYYLRGGLESWLARSGPLAL